MRGVYICIYKDLLKFLIIFVYESHLKFHFPYAPDVKSDVMNAYAEQQEQ